MPDISMCDSKTCSRRKECYRNEESGTKPCEWRQSYFLWPEGFDTEKCENFMEKWR